MAKHLVKALTMMTLMVVMSLAAAVVSANGQSRRTIATVPFKFVVGNAELAAGTYRIDAVTANGEGLKISGSDQAVFRLSSVMHRLEVASKSTLVFHRYGNQYFLAEVWIAGQSNGRQLMKSTSEKAVAGELSKTMKTGSQFERVEIALARD
jgi:hypothetical protein